MRNLTIGNITLKGNLILAPMAGVTDLPFRLLCKEQGADLVYTEMISAKGIFYNIKNTALNYEAVKKSDYRMNRKKRKIIFEDLQKSVM